MRLLLGFFLAFLATATQASTVFSPERPVSSPGYGAAVGTEFASAAATDGNDFLVVWSNGPLFASHVSASGEVRVPPVLIAVGNPQHVSACWTGSVYLVTWSDGMQNVMLASLSHDGNIVSSPHVIAPLARTFAGALASNGSNALLIYAAGNETRTSGALLDSQGNVLHANLASVAISTSVDDTIKVASDGSNFGVVWRTSTTHALVHAMPTPPPLSTTTDTYVLARVDASGQLVDPAGAVIGTTAGSGGFGIAYGGGRYALATLELKGDAATLRRFTIEAGTLQPDALPPIDTGGFEASVLWNGSDFITYWIDYDSNRFQFNTVAGTGEPAILFSGNYLGQHPILVSNGQRVLATWTDRSRMPAGTTYGGDLFGSFVDSSASLPSRFLIGYSARPQFKPAIATSAADSLVVWLDQMSDAGTGVLLAARMAADGRIIDTPPIDLGGDAYVAVNKPAVVFTGDGYFVAWEEATTGSTRGRRIDLNGQLGDILDFGPGLGPAVAWNGSVTLVAFERGTDMLGVRIDGNGKVLDNPPLVIAKDRGTTNASVASNGSDFLVIWKEGGFGGPSPDLFPNLDDVVGTRVSPSGAVDAALIEIATGSKDQYGGIVASDGRDYLVVYHLGDRLAAKTVTAEGTASADDGAIIGSNARDFSLAAESGGYALVWEDPTNARLQFTELDASGTPRENATLFQFAPGFGSTFPSIAASGGIVKVVYDRLSEQDNLVQRVFARFGSPARTRAMRPVK